jgi:hypothetical protein
MRSHNILLGLASSLSLLTLNPPIMHSQGTLANAVHGHMGITNQSLTAISAFSALRPDTVKIKDNKESGKSRQLMPIEPDNKTRQLLFMLDDMCDSGSEYISRTSGISPIFSPHQPRPVLLVCLTQRSNRSHFHSRP